MTEIQNGWRELPLVEVCDVIWSIAPWGRAIILIQVGIPFFQGKAEFGAVFPSARSGQRQGLKRCAFWATYTLIRARVGPTNLAPFECVIGRGLESRVRLGSLKTKYLFWAMRHTR